MECQYSLDLRLFKWFISNISIKIQLSPATPAISVFGTVESQSIHDYSSWWILRTGLERERVERLSEWRKTFRITAYFSSNKILVRSTEQICTSRNVFLASTENSIFKFSRLQLPDFRLAFDNADLNANYQNLRMAIFWHHILIFFLI